MKTIKEQVNEQIEKARIALKWMDEAGKEVDRILNIKREDRSKCDDFEKAFDAYFGWQKNVLREVRKLATLLGVANVKAAIPFKCTPQHLHRVYTTLRWQWAPIEASLTAVAKNLNND